MIETHVIEAISNLTHAVREWHREWHCRVEHQGSGSQAATKQDLEELRKEIMKLQEAFQKYAADQKLFNERQGKVVDSAVESLTGITGDIKGLNDKITELQNSVGEVTPEDAALIDDLQAQGTALASRSEALAAALKALDEATPPVVPPVS